MNPACQTFKTSHGTASCGLLFGQHPRAYLCEMRAIAKRFTVERPSQLEGVPLQVADAVPNIPIIDELPAVPSLVDWLKQTRDVLLAGQRHLLPLRVREP